MNLCIYDIQQDNVQLTTSDSEISNKVQIFRTQHVIYSVGKSAINVKHIKLQTSFDLSCHRVF